MAAKKIKKQAIAKAKSFGSSKPTAKPTLGTKASAKSVAPRAASVSLAAKSAATRVAEVEANLGESQSLAAFLAEIDW
jgi:hypothetical protein